MLKKISSYHLKNILSSSIKKLGKYIRSIQLKEESPLAIQKILSVTLFLPLYSTLRVLIWLYIKLYGTFRDEVTHVSGFRFNCALQDLIQRYIYLFGIWEPGITYFILRRLAAGDTFIDVGAHAGYYTIIASKIVGDSGRVLAIEASPRNFEMLKSNLKLNAQPNNIRAINIAVSDSQGKVDVYRGPKSNWGMTSTYKRNGFHREAQVDGARLETILKQKEIKDARLIKIDVEGSEYDFLEGVESLLKVCHKDAEFLIELSPKWWPEKNINIEMALRAFLEAKYFPYVIKNNYKIWHYLWPSERCKLERLEYNKFSLLSKKQIDVVFSRQDFKEI